MLPYYDSNMILLIPYYPSLKFLSLCFLAPFLFPPHQRLAWNNCYIDMFNECFVLHCGNSFLRLSPILKYYKQD